MDALDQASTELCPWSERREKAEVYWSFVMTAAALLAALAHLEHSFRGKEKAWQVLLELVIALVAPAYVIGQFVLSYAIAIGFSVLLMRRRAVELVPVDTTAYLEDFFWFNFSGGWTTLINADDNLARPSRLPIRSVGSIGPRVGRGVLQMIALVQSIAGIWKFALRYQRDDACVLLDYHMFWMNAACVLVLYQSLIMEYNGFARAPSSTTRADWSDYIPAALAGAFALGITPWHSFRGNFSQPRDPWLIPWAPWLFAAMSLDDEFLLYLERKGWNLLLAGVLKSFPLGPFFILGLILMCILVALLVPQISSRRTREKAVAAAVKAWRTFSFAMLGLHCLYTWIVCTVAYLTLVVLSYQNAFKLNGEEAWPVDQPCPQLWKDERWYPAF